jgi:signal transduction histidine kinase
VFARLSFFAWLALLAALWTGLPAAAQAPPFQVEAARSDWDAATPPAEGWTAVTLPDENWAGRWPGFDGVVWYRLRWHQSAAARPVGLMIDGINMAGAVYFNGALIDRDSQLVEPLSRSWNLSRYWVLDAPLSRPGVNELLVRVSGLAVYRPGLGRVTVGEPRAVRAQVRQIDFMRRTVQWLSIGLDLAIGILYGTFWLFRRKETAYGWFVLFALLWAVYSYNFVAISPWPFDGTEAFQRLNHLAMFAGVGCFLMFALTAGEVTSQAMRRVALAGIAAGLAALLLAPSSVQAPLRDLTVLTALAVYCLGYALIVRNAIRSPRAEAIAMALALSAAAAGGVHDTLVFLGWIADGIYVSSMLGGATILGISFALAWRMTKGMRLIENFNTELQQRVAQARDELAAALRRHHAAEIEQTRQAERMNLVRDLHDGLGLTLSSHLHALATRATRATTRRCTRCRRSTTTCA